MEEYKVRDVSRRMEGPDLDALLHFEVQQHASADPDLVGRLNITVQVANNSPVPAEYAVLRLLVDAQPTVLGSEEFSSTGAKPLVHLAGQEYSLRGYSHNHSTGNKRMPFFQGVSFTINAHPIVVKLPEAGDYAFVLSAVAPHMAERRKWYVVSWGGAGAMIMIKGGSFSSGAL